MVRKKKKSPEPEELQNWFDNYIVEYISNLSDKSKAEIYTSPKKVVHNAIMMNPNASASFQKNGQKWFTDMAVKHYSKKENAPKINNSVVARQIRAYSIRAVNQYATGSNLDRSDVKLAKRTQKYTMKTEAKLVNAGISKDDAALIYLGRSKPRITQGKYGLLYKGKRRTNAQIVSFLKRRKPVFINKGV